MDGNKDAKKNDAGRYLVKIRPLMDGNLYLASGKRFIGVKIRPLMDGNFFVGKIQILLCVKIRPLMDGNFL